MTTAACENCGYRAEHSGGLVGKACPQCAKVPTTIDYCQICGFQYEQMRSLLIEFAQASVLRTTWWSSKCRVCGRVQYDQFNKSAGYKWSHSHDCRVGQALVFLGLLEKTSD